MPDTIFTKIIRGEIPSHKVYEDDRVFAFLDIGPLSTGHTLVIPKEPAASLDQLSDESAAALGRVLPRICRAVMKATGASAYNVLQNNGAAAHQAVFHVHFHIIPKEAGAVGQAGAGLGVGWSPGKLDAATGAALAKTIAGHLAVERRGSMEDHARGSGAEPT
ncbi:MAG: HIT family protein [Phycisphaerales bacterium]